MRLHSKEQGFLTVSLQKGQRILQWNALVGFQVKKGPSLSEDGWRSDVPLASVYVLIVGPVQAVLIFLPHWVISTLVLKTKNS